MRQPAALAPGIFEPDGFGLTIAGGGILLWKSVGHMKIPSKLLEGLGGGLGCLAMLAIFGLAAVWWVGSQVAIVVMFFTTNWIGMAWSDWLTPLAGSIFAPLATALYVWRAGQHIPFEGGWRTWIEVILVLQVGTAIAGILYSRLPEKDGENQVSENPQLAPIWRRALCIPVDVFVFLMLSTPLQFYLFWPVLLFVWVASWIATSSLAVDFLTFHPLPEPSARLAAEIEGPIVAFIAFSIVGYYYAYFVSRHGATPGMILFGLEVVTPNGGRISKDRAVGRYMATLLSIGTFGVGLLVALWDPERRTLHDRLAGTRVISSSRKWWRRSAGDEMPSGLPDRVGRPDCPSTGHGHHSLARQ